MPKENKYEHMQKEMVSHSPEITGDREEARSETTGRREGSGAPSQDQLSDVWRELLGNRGLEMLASTFPSDMPIPTLEADPWSALLQANGVETVDLQHIHLQISDQEVEQLLKVMPDDLASPPLGSSNADSNS